MLFPLLCDYLSREKIKKLPLKDLWKISEISQYKEKVVSVASNYMFDFMLYFINNVTAIVTINWENGKAKLSTRLEQPWDALIQI